MDKQTDQNTSNENSSKQLSSQPYRGARDFYPEDMRALNYIFDTWKKVCKRYGFEEYSFPILEPFEIFAAKTGEEIVNEQMFNFKDKAGRRLAVRPELTPGTVRMLAQRYNQLARPMKWFMIGNNWRFERPQKGRGREFYQLEFNVFGVEDVTADFEIFSLIIAIMQEFGADEKQFKLNYSDRKLIKALLNDTLKLDEKKQLEIRRFMDKREKMAEEDFRKGLADLGLDGEQSQKVEGFLNAKLDTLSSVIPNEILEENQGYKDVMKLSELLKQFGLEKYCEFNPSIIRGFDYSDGTVYEVFDLNPKNNRSMFGGERFDNLIQIFGNYDLPATGVAMGDMTLLEFLQGWELLPTLSTKTKVYVTIFNEETMEKSIEIVQKLREEGINSEVALEPIKLDKQLKYADKKGIPFVIVLGPDEIEKGTVMLKDMKAKSQEELTIDKLIVKLRE